MTNYWSKVREGGIKLTKCGKSRRLKFVLSFDKTLLNTRRKNRKTKKRTYSQNSMTGDVALGFVMLVAFSP